MEYNFNKKDNRESFDGYRKLKSYRDADISNCSNAELCDIQNIEINRSDSVPERLSSYLQQIKNPYLFKVGGVVVKVEFNGNKTLRDALSEVVSISGK